MVAGSEQTWSTSCNGPVAWLAGTPVLAAGVPLDAVVALGHVPDDVTGEEPEVDAIAVGTPLSGIQ